MTNTTFLISSKVEEAAITLERAGCLLSLLMNELDEIPNEFKTDDDTMTAIAYAVTNSDILRALSDTVYELVKRSLAELGELEADLAKEKDPCITDQSTLQGSNQNTPHSGTARL